MTSYNHPDDMPVKEREALEKLKQLYEPHIPSDNPLRGGAKNWLVLEKNLLEMTDEELAKSFGDSDGWGTLLDQLLLRKTELSKQEDD